MASRARWLLTTIVVLALLIGAVRLAMTPTPITGYRVLDDYNVAIQITGSKAQWRGVTVEETPSAVTVDLKEISLRLAGFDDDIAYVSIRLQSPLADRAVIDASSGSAVRRVAP
jgi:hypothetical protein